MMVITISQVIVREKPARQFPLGTGMALPLTKSTAQVLLQTSALFNSRIDENSRILIRKLSDTLNDPNEADWVFMVTCS